MPKQHPKKIARGDCITVVHQGGATMSARYEGPLLGGYLIGFELAAARLLNRDGTFRARALHFWRVPAETLERFS